MGLDMQVWVMKSVPDKPIEFDPHDHEVIRTWRKHAGLVVAGRLAAHTTIQATNFVRFIIQMNDAERIKIGAYLLQCLNVG